MNKTLKWTKRVFGSTYLIYDGDKAVGTLKANTWRQSAIGGYHEQQYLFKTTGVFRQQTDIIDQESNSIIGKISYNSWMTKANIEFKDRNVFWKYDNTWQTKWSLSDFRGTLIRYRGGTRKGTIECTDASELLILTGLFVTNFYWQMTIVATMVVIIPLFATMLV